MNKDILLRNREPQSGPAAGRASGVIGSIETVEDMGQIFFGYAGPIVFHPDSGIGLLPIRQVYRFCMEANASAFEK